ncbi:hypothetical protein HanRHA438_Chr11g0481521 [Helianthus annuus]|uniref:Uncharacterized protein n=1 Tax=Helianthus annuus TaxID=4232 RepID=A0A251T9J4_HELAN|nr:hypothetical protein HanXRQr2_Chr11g0467491 [Helianthus annuus]KAJ0630369.1 hypothetical protein HanHA300_Chr00c0300g0741241 [Helianthus annuus]KAJ0687738.1 hypothetical protein HanOQP8_Chr11g0386761 [Helianthus annuus]KAJ0868734.1 hypothetical protein HanRHA438_Chr11g0481521 [Helianthus annuus]KAJ0873310.1 hypothetical protein HanPSC8_Chr11g0451191 [Helianthus annuus]
MGDIKATMCGIPPVTSASMALHRPLSYFLGVRGRYGGGSIPVTSANGMCRGFKGALNYTVQVNDKATRLCGAYMALTWHYKTPRSFTPHPPA